MTLIDLDDLPPRIASLLAALGSGEELILVQGGAVVARLHRTAEQSPAAPDDAILTQEEVLDHFNAMIHDEF
jgi:antitoxin (DNA-binding transcriptional repressor) of toxin-antitoxin stability system